MVLSRRPARYGFILTLVLLLAGCAGAAPDRQAAFADIGRTLDTRLAQQVHWYQGDGADEAARRELEQLMDRPLSAAAAVQIALLNNQHLQSEYAALGIARADLIQAGLIGNPTLFSSVRFPSGGGRKNLEFSIAQSFLDVLLRPARERLAHTEFERVRQTISQTLLDFSADVVVAYREVQAAARLVEVLELLDESAQAGYELAQRFDDAGNISPLALSRHRTIAAEARTELARARITLQDRRDALSKLLGLTGSAPDWTLEGRLPGLPEAALTMAEVAESARQQRLDLAALRSEGVRIEQALAMTRNYRYLGGAEFGVSAERETDGSSLIGPNFAIELPLFDRRQAQIARLEALRRGNEAAVAALEADIDNDVRAAVHRLQGLRELAQHYRDEVIPAGEALVEHTQAAQNYMLVDVFELLVADRRRRAGYRGYIETLRDYWVARAELQRLTAAAVSAMPAASPGEVQP